MSLSGVKSSRKYGAEHCHPGDAMPAAERFDPVLRDVHTVDVHDCEIVSLLPALCGASMFSVTVLGASAVNV